ncbi:glycosyltransferase family 2 protein [Hymenobacter oligotrophus]|uniref:Glycosyltransferase family 2 protein n=1 Tax=Hymenobacter oligotrophus TaxID=2319843 RepID=A0A3B7R1F6_9BACT|nr:glycosyltransferase family 2 protein [Hymenobacter oligotrophus]AYA37190.1 glycosyltransferase family 2 protein [Hymenobacter oligotrophus]
MVQVSVIIINYNTFKLTSEAIESIQRYTQGVTHEIILVDNASSECDPGLFTQRFPTIKLVRNPDNSGFAKGNNLGIQHATGETILLFNSDAACLNDALSLTYRALQAEPKVGVVTGRLEFPDGKLQYQCGRFPSAGLQLLELLRVQKLLSPARRGEILQGGFFAHDKPLYPDWVWGTYFHFKREVLTKLPGQKLPDDFFMYAEDLQWSYAIRKLGYDIKYVPEAHILHHFSQSTRKEKKLNQLGMILRNEDAFMRQAYGWWGAKSYYLVKMLNLLTARGGAETNRHLARQYSRLLLGRPL